MEGSRNGKRGGTATTAACTTPAAERFPPLAELIRYLDSLRAREPDRSQPPSGSASDHPSGYRAGLRLWNQRVIGATPLPDGLV